MFTSIEKELVLKGLTEAIKNCNRIFHSWVKESTKKGSFLKFSITEVRGLVKGEMFRSLRRHMLSQDIDNLFRIAHLFIQADMVKGNINGISLGEVDSWKSSSKSKRDEMNELLLKVPYKELHYNESDYSFIGDIQSDSNSTFNPHFVFSTQAIESFQF